MAQLKPATKRDASRAASASAIETLAQAENDWKAATDARERASERLWSSELKLDKILEAGAEAPPDDSNLLIAVLGRGADICELERPTVERQLAEETAGREVKALRSAREQLERTIAARRDDVESVRHRLNDAVAEVVRSSVDITALIEEAKRAQAQIVAKRAALMSVSSALPFNSDERRTVDNFLMQLAAGGVGGEEHQAAVQTWCEACERLKVDPDAPLPQEVPR